MRQIMKMRVISFRHSGKAVDVAEEICRQNGITLTSYIVGALLQTIYAKIKKGVIDPPRDMPLPPSIRTIVEARRKRKEAADKRKKKSQQKSAAPAS